MDDHGSYCIVDVTLDSSDAAAAGEAAGDLDLSGGKIFWEQKKVLKTYRMAGLAVEEEGGSLVSLMNCLWGMVEIRLTDSTDVVLCDFSVSTVDTEPYVATVGNWEQKSNSKRHWMWGF